MVGAADSRTAQLLTDQACSSSVASWDSKNTDCKAENRPLLVNTGTVSPDTKTLSLTEYWDNLTKYKDSLTEYWDSLTKYKVSLTEYWDTPNT